MTKFDFCFDTEYGRFCDAIVFFDGEEVPSDEVIEAIKQQRLANWIAEVAPQEPEEVAQ